MDFASEDKRGWYQVYRIPKKSGGLRKIEAPNDGLKKDQHALLKLLYSMYAPSVYSYGGIKNKNITMAAEKHVKNKYKMKMDIHDFFNSTHGKSVYEALIRHKDMDADTARKVCYMCTNADGVLPQGAPTSTFLANISSEKMINAIGHVCGNFGITFTMYVDDIVISGDTIDKLLRCSNIIRGILSRYGYFTKKSKTVFMRKKQEILGLCATKDKQHARLPKKKRNYLRGVLHTIEKTWDKSHKVDRALWQKVVGKVAFANMAHDQHSGRFNAAVLRINTKIKGEKEHV